MRSRPSSSPALPFDGPLSTAPRRRRGRAGESKGRGLAYWLPVALPLAIVAQIGLGGLKPALVESRRLDGVQERMLERYHSAQAERAELERWLRAQNDPIYLERERRLLLAPDSPLRNR